MKIQLKRSNQLQNGAAKPPTPEQMEWGELAVNYNGTDPVLFIKAENAGSGKIIRLAGSGAPGEVDSVQGELPIIVDNTDPINPVIKFADVPTDGKQYVRVDGAWQEVYIAPQTIISSTRPQNVALAQLWWADTDIQEGGGRLYIWTGEEWVDTSLPGGGEDIEALQLKVADLEARLEALEGG